MALLDWHLGDYRKVESLTVDISRFEAKDEIVCEVVSEAAGMDSWRVGRQIKSKVVALNVREVVLDLADGNGGSWDTQCMEF